MRSLSSSSSQQKQPRTIWFQLIDHAGHSYKQAAISGVKLPPDSNVDDFLRAIKAEYPKKFSSIDMLEVEVYRSKDSFKDWKFPLSVNKSESLLRYEVIPVEVDALIVLIPPDSIPEMAGTEPSKEKKKKKEGKERKEKVGLAVDSELTRFWNSLATLAPDDQNILNFPICPVFFPKRMQSLYIRESYKDLYKIICKNLELPDSESSARMAITGTPGIGKSMFLFYILWRLSKIKTTETVVLRRQKDEGDIFVFQRDKCWVASNYSDVKYLLLDKSTWYLTDTLSDPPAESIMATTILVSSPARKHYKEFLKYSDTAPLHYLPVWSLEELHLARKMYSMTQRQVEKRYLLIGGIPRFVLEKKHDLIKEIKRAVGRLAISKFDLIASGATEREDEISHLVVHYDVDSTYTDISLCMGSVFITEQALEKFVQEQEQDLKRFLAKAEYAPYLATLRGNLFEGYAHRLLAAGGEFPIRSLDDENINTTLRLKKRKTNRFYEISDCRSNNVYCIPWSPTYPCIDATIPKVGHFQMTTSPNHPLPEPKMRKIVEESQENRLYFVVPHTIYETFPQQTLSSKESKSSSTVGNKKRVINSTRSSRSVKKRKITEDGKGVSSQLLHQFALCINMK